jgi:spoIIIJ-associated protein
LSRRLHHRKGKRTVQELEASGKSVEQAIQKALDKLGVSRDQVDVVILSEGKPGMLGVGGEDARILVRMLVSDDSKESQLAQVAREVLEGLLSMMGISASVAQIDTDPVTLNIRGDDLGILIGRRGQTLASLQYVVRILVSHRSKGWLPVVIDVEEYKQRRYRALQVLANRMAERVKEKKVPFVLEPMPAYERRIIHLTLAEHPDVTTQSVGQDEARKVVIVPRT